MTVSVDNLFQDGVYDEFVRLATERARKRKVETKLIFFPLRAFPRYTFICTQISYLLRLATSYEQRKSRMINLITIMIIMIITIIITKVGDPFSKESEQGPQVDGEQQEKV